jgi:hypothetical protein
MTATTAPPSIFDGIRDIFKERARRRPLKDPEWNKAITCARQGLFFSAYDIFMNGTLVSIGISPNVTAANATISVFNFLAAVKNVLVTERSAEYAEMHEIGTVQQRPKGILTLEQCRARNYAVVAVSTAVQTSCQFTLAADSRARGYNFSGIFTLLGSVMAIFSAGYATAAYHFWRKGWPPSGGNGPKP